MNHGNFSNLPRDMLIKIILSGFNVKNLDLVQSVQLEEELKTHITNIKTEIIKKYIIDNFKPSNGIISLDEVKSILSQIEEISPVGEGDDITLHFDINKYDSFIDFHGPGIYARNMKEKEEWNKISDLVNKFYAYLKSIDFFPNMRRMYYHANLSKQL